GRERTDLGRGSGAPGRGLEFIAESQSLGEERSAPRPRQTHEMTRISFHELAERELNDAALYYEHESVGLGIKFLNEVMRYIDGIVKNPNAGKKVRGQVRRRVLRTFPFGILYSVKDDGIRILAIMNLKRRPLYWVGRS